MKLTGKKSGKGRRVTHIRIHRGANGFEVNHEREPMKRTMNQPYSPEPENKPSYFTGKTAQQDMIQHVGQLAGQMGSPDDEAAEGEAPQSA